jgi:hypothetical protein
MRAEAIIRAGFIDQELEGRSDRQVERMSDADSVPKQQGDIGELAVSWRVISRKRSGYDHAFLLQFLNWITRRSGL